MENDVSISQWDNRNSRRFSAPPSATKFIAAEPALEPWSDSKCASSEFRKGMNVTVYLVYVKQSGKLFTYISFNPHHNSENWETPLFYRCMSNGFKKTILNQSHTNTIWTKVNYNGKSTIIFHKHFLFRNSWFLTQK